MASFTERYHELTKYNPNTIDKLGSVHWEDQPALFKDPMGADSISLQQWNKEIEKGGMAIASEGVLDLPTLARMLYHTAGITAAMNTPSGPHYFRANPSAGGLYPIEIYAHIQKIDGLKKGLYYYHPLHNSLLTMTPGNTLDISEIFLAQEPATEAQALIFFTGVFSRSAWRYKERAYRRVLLDCGHSLGNLLETAEYFQIRFALLGGFVDELCAKALSLTPGDEVPLLAVALFDKNHSSTPMAKQYGSLTPEQAVLKRDPETSVQVQQNCCERIPSNQNLLAHENPDIPLPRPTQSEILNLLFKRRSCREYSGESLSLSQMNEMLAFAFGGLSQGKWNFTMDLLQNYLIALRVSDLTEGIYQLTEIGSLGPLLQAGNFEEEMYRFALGQNLGASCSFSIIHTIELSRLVERYGDRGYRYANFDAGQIGERINLSADSLGLGASGIGGYFDDLANEILQIPLTHAVIYMTTVGIPA